MKYITQKKKRIYLDYAAATPVRRVVIDAMKPYQKDIFANASAIHSEGVEARIAIENARKRLARLLNIRPSGVVFTGSGTESNNLAIMGVVAAEKLKGRAYSDMEVVSTRIEHPSVSNVLSHLERLGVTVRYMEVDGEGMIRSQSLQDVLNTKTIVVSFAYANSEIGVVQPVGKLTRIVRAVEKKHNTRIVVHIDAAQAPLWLPCQMDRLLVDCMSLDAGKCYGPKGVGVLAMRHGVVIAPVMYGGPQEHTLRPSTKNTAGIVGAVEAICIAQDGMLKRVQQVTKVRDNALQKLMNIEGVMVNGSLEHRIANNINISIPGIDSEFAVVSLDVGGVACSTQSACSGATGVGSKVVQEISGTTAQATSTIRFSLGEETKNRDMKKAIQLLMQHIQKMSFIQAPNTSRIPSSTDVHI